MTKKEMIEEMASDMNFACIELSKEQRLEIARVLINLDYLKISEGSVVLQQKDLLKLQNVITQSCNSRLDVDAVNYLTNTVESLKKQVKELEEQRDRQAYIAEELIQEKHRWTEQARKERAKEILQEMLDFIHNETFRKGYELKKVERKIKEIAKIKGVEVEE